MPDPKARMKKWLYTRSIGLCSASLGGQGTSVLAAVQPTGNVATACYPAPPCSHRVGGGTRMWPLSAFFISVLYTKMRQSG